MHITVVYELLRAAKEHEAYTAYLMPSQYKSK